MFGSHCHFFIGKITFLPLSSTPIVILPLFFNFVILPSLFSNETPVYPCFVTPSKMLGLNGKKKKKKRHLHEKTMIPLSPFLLSHPFARPIPDEKSRLAEGFAAWQRRSYSSLLPAPPRRGSSSLLPAPPRCISSSLRHTPAARLACERS